MRHLAMALAGLLAAPLPAWTATTYTAMLSGAQEVPANGTSASGTAVLVLNDAMDSLSLDLSVTGIALGAATGGHFHAAPAGTNGPVVYGFIGLVSDLDGDLVATPRADGFDLSVTWDGAEGRMTTLSDQLAALMAGGLYLNIHTADFPGGEIRGQISAVPLPGALGLLLAGTAGLGLLRRR